MTGKLKRVLGLCKRTINDARKIGANDLKHVFTWIDGSHMVHTNMRGQTGGCMSMGT